MVGKEDDPASYWVSVTFQGLFLLNFGGYSTLIFFSWPFSLFVVEHICCNDIPCFEAWRSKHPSVGTGSSDPGIGGWWKFHPKSVHMLSTGYHNNSVCFCTFFFLYFFKVFHRETTTYPNPTFLSLRSFFTNDNNSPREAFSPCWRSWKTNSWTNVWHWKRCRWFPFSGRVRMVSLVTVWGCDVA